MVSQDTKKNAEYLDKCLIISILVYGNKHDKNDKFGGF